MKLARIVDNEPFYSVVVERETGAELFDFGIVVPNTLRPDMPLSHLEYLPVLMRMQERAGVLSRAAARLQDAPDDEYQSFRRPLAGNILLPPVSPPSFRSFAAFAPHGSGLSQERQTQSIYERAASQAGEQGEPFFTFQNAAGFIGPDTPLPMPSPGGELDWGLEWGAVIGKPGRNISIEAADEYIAGYTICNNWYLRDVERREQAAGRGPGKSRDFASSLGPYLVTPDELTSRALPDTVRGKRYDLTLTARVNGQEAGCANARDMRWTFAEMIAYASHDADLHPGDLIGSGTGDVLYQPEQEHRPLAPLQAGDVVRLEIELLGALENRIA